MKEFKMLYLMKRNAVAFIWYTALLVVLKTLWWIFIRETLSPYMVVFQGQWMILIVLGAITVNEKSEEKSNGYAFLGTLPLIDTQIVAAKFSLAFLTVLFLVGFENLLYNFISGPAELFALGRILILVSALLGLILAALMYIFIYKYGHIRSVILIFVAVVMIIPSLLTEFVIMKMDIDFHAVLEDIIGVNTLLWICLTVLGLGLYLALMQFAIKVKKAKKGST